MKKELIFIFFIFSHLVFSVSLAMAFSEVKFSDLYQLENLEEISSEIESYLPGISHEYAAELAEAIQLIKELEREIYLTNKIIELREKGDEEGIQSLLKKEESEVREKKVTILEEVIVEEPISEEILIAKHISEEPGKSLPREEKSLIEEMEKKAGLPQPEVMAIPVAKTKVYSKEEIKTLGLEMVIEKDQTAIISARDIRRFMVTDPTVIKVATTDEELSVTGVNLGNAFLHIWDSEGRSSIRFNVRQRGYHIFLEAQKRAIEAAKMESFKVRYSFDRFRLNSKSLNADRSYHFTNWIHGLGITGETPWGMTVSKFQYEGREFGRGTEVRDDLTAWFSNLRGKDVEIYVGDTGAYFSDITLPGTGYQGIRLRNPDKKNINYDFVWGVRGNRMWGYRVVHWVNENYFGGFRGQIEPADFIHFNATALRSLEDGIDVGEYLYASGFGLNFLDDAIKFESEFARSKSLRTVQHDHAYKIDTDVRLKDYNLTLRSKYRDVDPNFLTVTGSGISYVGTLGHYFDVEYNPFKYLRLKGQYNLFRNRADFNPAETHKYNYDWRASVDFDIGTKTDFSYSNWKVMREGESTPIHSYGTAYNLTHNLSLPPPMRSANLYFSYSPNQYKNLGSRSSDYKERRYTAGVGGNVIKNLYYDLGYSWHFRKMLESGENGTVRSLSTGLRYSTRILNTPFSGALALRYNEEYGVMENLPLTGGENVISGDAEINYAAPETDFNTSIRVNYQHIRGVLDHNKNRQETRIMGGGTYLFDTTLRCGTGGSVRGIVFKDFNGNGLKDMDEVGLAGINVYAGEVKSIVTDANGNFEFIGLKGYETSVMFDTKMLPEGHRSTTPNPQVVKLEHGFVSEANFGVMTFAEISGRVFSDVNMNEIFDEGDKGIYDILIILDDGTAVQTATGGYYRIENVKTGTKTITMDTITLPPNLLPLTANKRTIEVKQGKYYEENFPLYALRTVVGNVFIDENQNRQFDPAEKGVADIVLRCADSVAITDSNGRFFLKKLPGGTQEIIMDVESIPSDYELAVEPSRTVELLAEGEIEEDVDFALRRR